jgi:hypothetical protein
MARNKLAEIERKIWERGRKGVASGKTGSFYTLGAEFTMGDCAAPSQFEGNPRPRSQWKAKI